MFNGFAIALASEGHVRYFKAQKASEGNRFHKPDSQYHTERDQKTNKSNKNVRFPCFSVSSKPHSQYHTQKQQKATNPQRIL